MKKIIALIVALITLLSLASFSACSKDNDGKITVYAPDGAPALSIARLLNDKTLLDGKFDYNIVTATTINAYITGENPIADIAIIPVNAGVKMLGDGSMYKMLGTVTNGNLFILKKQNGEDISSTSDLSKLIGKTVGVINLNNVPGLTFKAILNDNQIPFTTLSDTGEVDATKVNLKGLTAGTEVVPNSTCDYFIAPEPAVTTKINMTNGKILLSGSLQALYGDGNGYPQAIVVAKNSVISSNKDLINEFINSFADNKAWLLDENTSAQTIVNAVTNSFLKDDTAPTFTASNLNKTVIINSAISFTSAQNAKQAVLDYMQKINAISNNSFGTPLDAFFYQ
ncbi:MAG: hypothetical protein J6V68_02435 [Clostridia bacterium]|nr:hypothetical protein [Clostridia bacterium]